MNSVSFKINLKWCNTSFFHLLKSIEPSINIIYPERT